MSTHGSTRFAIAATIVALLPTFVHGAILSSKRGFADTGANYNNLQATGAGWYYTWGTGTGSPGTFDALNYPEFWGSASQSTIDTTLTRNPNYILGYNEPEVSTQANMSVATAIANWTTISNSTVAYNSAHGTNIQLVSPAVSDTTAGKAWMTDFHTQAVAAGLKVDEVAFHWYGWSTPSNISQAAANFEGSVNWYHNLWNKPVFITEFAIHDWGGSYTDAQIIEANRQFLSIVIPWMESTSYVAGYSWYNWFSDSPLYDTNSYEPTVMAYDYIGAVRSGSTADIGGTNLGEHIAYLNGGQLTMTGSAGTIKYLEALYDPNVTTNTSVITGTIDWAPSTWTKIQAGATLKKSGTNTISLTSGTVTNNGVLEVAQGVLRLSVGASSGQGSILISSTGDTTGSTARLELTGGTFVPYSITFAQRNDPAGSDGIRNVSGNNTLDGPMTITTGGNQARVQSDAGQLTLNGPITTNATSARNFYLQGAGNGVVGGVISDNASNSSGTINLYKQGAGTWTLTAPNTYGGTTTISQGTLRLNTVAAPSVAHRWSFNNSLVDSVGGSTATIVDVGANNVTLSATQATVTGGDRASSDYIQLGSKLLPNTNTPVTIELWATQNTVQNWGRIFDFGSSTTESLIMTWTRGTTSVQDRVEWVDGSIKNTADDTNQPYTTNTEYHIAMVLTPVGSQTLVTWYSAPSGNANLGTARGTFITNNTLANLTDSADNLARSFWSADSTANASYNEVRLWNGALSSNALEILHDAGPDANLNSLNLGSTGSLPSTTAVSMTASGATLDLNGINQTIGSLAGVAGTSVLLGSGTLTTGGNGLTTTFSGNISGTGGLIKNGSGTFTLAGTNTYNGTTWINNGVLKGGAVNVLPNGSGNGNVSIASGAKLDLGSFSQTINGLSGNGTVDNSVAGNPVLTVGANDANSTFNGVIQNTVGSIALLKTGSGTLTLSGNITNKGMTIVNDGELIISGAVVSIGSVSILGGYLQVDSPLATMNDITGDTLIVGDGSSAASLTADSITVATLTIGGATSTINLNSGDSTSDSMQSIPEPSTWILCLFAAAGVLLIGLQRKFCGFKFS
ncbi:MAG: glycosyl hydrolase [Thermoguttaceae bacterium]|jgi:autotransporter-associated beta strand protein